MTSSATDRRALIAAGGQVVDPDAVRRAIGEIGGIDVVIAADGGGLRHLSDLRMQAHVVVGDLDSIAGDELDDAVKAGAQVVPFPSDKNETDLELAITEAFARNATSILVVGALGGRLDHELANVGLLAATAQRSGRRVEAFDGARHLWFVTDQLDLALPEGAPLALLPWHGDATGVTTTGVQWPLDDETLPAGSPRGISNVCTASRQTVSVRNGVLVVAHDPAAAAG